MFVLVDRDDISLTVLFKYRYCNNKTVCEYEILQKISVFNTRQQFSGIIKNSYIKIKQHVCIFICLKKITIFVLYQSPERTFIKISQKLWVLLTRLPTYVRPCSLKMLTHTRHFLI